jgi:hypothetical protein
MGSCFVFEARDTLAGVQIPNQIGNCCRNGRTALLQQLEEQEAPKPDRNRLGLEARKSRPRSTEVGGFLRFGKLAILGCISDP